MIIVRNEIPAGNKFALSDLSAGEAVIKYGYPVGHLTQDVRQGELVNELNDHTNLDGILDYTYSPSLEAVPATATRTFKGFRRPNGEVGVRNQIWIIPTVGCVNAVCEELANIYRRKLKSLAGVDSSADSDDNFGSVDAVVAFTHNYGCSQLGDDMMRFPRCRKVALTLRGSVNANINTWGACLYSEGSLKQSRRYEITDIVDRVGGGDSFMGGLIYGLMTYENDQKSLDFAVAASCLKHTIYGDYNLVTVPEVEKLMNGDASGRVSR